MSMGLILNHDRPDRTIIVSNRIADTIVSLCRQANGSLLLVTVDLGRPENHTVLSP